MKIRRFFATDMRKALKQVSEELGPDAAIMSTRKTNGGIEIVAATDYDAAIEQHKNHAKRKQQAVSVDASSTNSLINPKPKNPVPTADIDAFESRLNKEFNNTENSLKDEKPVTKETVSSSGTANSGIEWIQEPNLIAIKEEVGLMRELLQDQLGELAWHDKNRRSPIQASILRKLVNMGFSPRLASSFASTIDVSRTNNDDFEPAWQQLRANICAAMPKVDQNILSKGGIVSLVGPTGVGKTTTIAKLAARFVVEYGSENLALITTDCYRVSAHEQLRTYANIMGVSMRVADDAESLAIILNELSDKKLVLIDTAGISQRDQRLAEQMSCLMNSGKSIDSYLVLSTTAQALVLKEAIKTFNMIPLAGVILTKLDESASLGESLGEVISEKIKVAYITDGQKVPEDLHFAEPFDLFNRAVNLGHLDNEDWVTAMKLNQG